MPSTYSLGIFHPKEVHGSTYRHTRYLNHNSSLVELKQDLTVAVEGHGLSFQIIVQEKRLYLGRISSILQGKIHLGIRRHHKDLSRKHPSRPGSFHSQLQLQYCWPTFISDTSRTLKRRRLFREKVNCGSGLLVGQDSLVGFGHDRVFPGITARY